MTRELERPEPVIEGRLVEPGDINAVQEIVWALNRLGEALRETMINVQATLDGWDWYEPHQPGKPHRYTDREELLARVQTHWKDTHL